MNDLTNVSPRIMGTACRIHNITRFPIHSDDEIGIATEQEVHMEQMKLDALRKEDEIRARPKPPMVPSMPQVLKQAPRRPISRDETAVWPTFQPPPHQSHFRLAGHWSRRYSGTPVESRRGARLRSSRKWQEGDDWDKDGAQVFEVAMKVIDERIEVETDGMLTCQPDYDAIPWGQRRPLSWNCQRQEPPSIQL
jgi:hypothetical protein